MPRNDLQSPIADRRSAAARRTRGPHGQPRRRKGGSVNLPRVRRQLSTDRDVILSGRHGPHSVRSDVPVAIAPTGPTHVRSPGSVESMQPRE